MTFTTPGHEPVCAQEADTKQESKLVDPKQLTDQQWAMIILISFVVFAVLLAVVAQQIIKYRSSSAAIWKTSMRGLLRKRHGKFPWIQMTLSANRFFNDQRDLLQWKFPHNYSKDMILFKLTGGWHKDGEKIDLQQYIHVDLWLWYFSLFRVLFNLE